MLRLLSVTAEGSSGWHNGCLDDPGYPIIELDDKSIAYRVEGIFRKVGVIRLQ
jgi:hypothetical protein